MSNQNTSWKNYVASVSAGVVSICTFNSLDTLRVRWQVVDKVAHKDMTAYIKDVMRTEGFLHGFQLPAMVSNAMAVGCSTGLRLGMYPLVRETLSGGKLDGKDVSGLVMVSAGLSCGMLSYFLATPLWSIKTRQQGDVALNAGGQRISIWSYIMSDFRDGGIRGLWKGAAPLTLRGGLISADDFAKSRAKQLGLMQDGTVLHVASSIVSALSASTLATPVDVVFSRYVTSKEKSMTDIVRAVIRERAIFRGWTALFIRFAPTFSLAMPIFEHIRFLLGLGYL